MPCASSPTLRTHSIAQNGFAIIPDVFRDEEITSLLREFESAGMRRSRAGLRHAMRIPAVTEFARDPRLLNIAHEVLGLDAFPFRATLFDKSPVSNWLVVWHQDTALPLRVLNQKCKVAQEREGHGLQPCRTDPEKSAVLTAEGKFPGWGPWSTKEGILYAHAPAEALNQVLALRIHLDDSTSTNGPLRVLPGTHNLGVLTDEQIETLTREHQKDDVVPDETIGAGMLRVRSASADALARNGGVPSDSGFDSPGCKGDAKHRWAECTIRRGGVLAMRPLIVHASSKSHDNAPRRVLHIEYAATLTIAPGLELATA